MEQSFSSQLLEKDGQEYWQFEIHLDRFRMPRPQTLLRFNAKLERFCGNDSRGGPIALVDFISDFPTNSYTFVASISCTLSAYFEAVAVNTFGRYVIVMSDLPGIRIGDSRLKSEFTPVHRPDSGNRYVAQQRTPMVFNRTPTPWLPRQALHNNEKGAAART